MTDMPTISARIDKETKEKIEAFPDVNWSQVVREAINHRIEEEMKKQVNKDWDSIRKASDRIDSLRRKCEGNSTEELRRWREQRK